MSCTETAVLTIKSALKLVGKLPLAQRAGVDDTLLRGIDSDCPTKQWNPTRRTLRRLERAALEVIAEQKGEAA